MVIAVSIFRKNDNFYTKVLYGNPINIKICSGGKIAIFKNNSLILYEVVFNKTNVYLLRNIGDTKVPFVVPKSNIILHGRSKLQKNKIIKTLYWMVNNNYNPESFDDLFWMKISSIINKKNYGKNHIQSIIFNHKNQ